MSHDCDRPMCLVCREDYTRDWDSDPTSDLRINDDYEGAIGICPDCLQPAADREIELLDSLCNYQEVIYWLYRHHSRLARAWDEIGHKSNASWERKIAIMCEAVAKHGKVIIPGRDDDEQS